MKKNLWPTNGKPWTQEQIDDARQFYFANPRIADVRTYTGADRKTVQTHKLNDDWDAKREVWMEDRGELAEHIDWLSNPDTTENDKKDFISKNFLDIMALQSVSIKQLASKDHVNATLLVGALQKLATSMEKITNAQVKEKTQGVQRVEGHIAKWDMAKITELRLKHHRETGEWISYEQIMETLTKDPKQIKDVN